MDLFCPHCSRRISVPDDKAGQAMSCPLCAKQFMAPSLAPSPVAPKPPAPPPVSTAPVEIYSTGPAPAPVSAAPKSSKPAEAAAAPPAPPSPPGEYAHSFAIYLNDRWLAFVPLACLVLIFFLSFFTWHNIDLRHTPSLWGMAFTEQKVLDEELRPVDVKQAHLLAYTILMILCFPFALACLPFDKGCMPGPPAVAPFMMFKNLLLGLLLGLTFLLLCFDFADGNILQARNPITLPMKIAFRLHFLAMLASFGMFWLHWRKKSNLPLPKGEFRW